MISITLFLRTNKTQTLNKSMINNISIIFYKSKHLNKSIINNINIINIKSMILYAEETDYKI